MLKKILCLLFLSSLCLQTNCAMKPPDEPICVEITPERGGCVRIMSGEQFMIDEEHKFNGKTWWEMRPALIQLPASSWAEIRAFIIKLCRKSNQCGENVTNWERTVQTIDTNVQSRLP